MAGDIFTHEVFTSYILPWVLVFVLIFAMLEKSNLLGEGKKQINAIVAAVAGLILLAFPASRDAVVGLIPFLVVVAVIIFVFMLLYGFVAGETKGSPFSKGVKIGLGVVIAIALIIAILVVTNTFSWAKDFFTKSTTGTSIIFALVAIAAVIAVILGSAKKKD